MYVHVYMWYSTYVQMYRYICFSITLVHKMYVYDQYLCMCSYFCPRSSCMYLHTYVYNTSLYACGLPAPTSCVMHCWLSALYRTGLIKDLLLCSGYRDSSSLRPS